MDKLKIGEQYNGFRLKSKDKIKHLSGEAYLFEHEVSGATLLFIESTDTNKVFNVTFKTLPTDDTGAAHILEHSVLCGSRKYNVKDPFNELLKGSLHTFLNAMTYSDKTMYPIATTNATEFITLTGIYLDAVFCPNLLEHKEIFMQEGVHYVPSEDTISIGGVVYNEMRGASSSAEYVLSKEINKELLRGTIYANMSGGSPEAIENLTYEQLISFYKEFYHPSNCLLYAYGDVDLFPLLRLLDEEYLSQYKKPDQITSSFGELNNSFNGNTVKDLVYPISDSENNSKNSYFALSYAINNDDTQKGRVTGLQLLSALLVKTPASPLKNSLIELGLCDDVFVFYDPTVKYSAFSIIAKNAHLKDADLFREKVIEILTSLYEKDFNRDFIEGVLNIQEFSLREQNYGSTPKGIMYAINASASFVNGWDIPLYLSDKLFNSVLSKSYNGYFKGLIKDCLLDNKNCCFFIMKAVENLQSQLDEELTTRLKDKWDNMSQKDKEMLAVSQNKFQNWQQREDTPEALSAISTLNISDLSKAPIIIPSEKEDSFIVNRSTVDLNDIVYANITFSLSSISPTLHSYCALLCAYLSKCDTKNYNYVALNEKLLSNVGGFNIYTNSYSNMENGYFYPKIVVKTKLLGNKLDNVIELMSELICNAIFDNEEQLMSIIAEEKAHMEYMLTANGHNSAILQALSSFSSEHSFYNMTRGIEYYLFLSGIAKNISGCKEQMLQLYRDIFTKNNCFIGVTVSKNSSDSVIKKLKNFTRLLPESKDATSVGFVFLPDQRYEAFITPSKNNANVKASDYLILGHHYNGKLRVLENILEQVYLWNNVRIEGGAYGCGASFFSCGRMYTYSMRDPNIQKTYEIFDKIPEYLEDFTASDKDMTRYIIGAVGALDRPLTNEQKNDIMIGRYFSGLSDELLSKRRTELLSTTSLDIKQFAPLLSDCINNSSICTIGNQSDIQHTENSPLFLQIKTLL